MKYKTLECGSCGVHFKGRQHWNWDNGFGRCLGCIIEQLAKTWAYATTPDELIAGAKEQWPDQYGE